MSTEQELLKQLAELKKLKQRGVQQGVVVQKAKVDIADGDLFSLEPVFEYMRALNGMPWLMLLARYEKDVGKKPPRTTRDWLVEKMARKFQNELYMKHKGKIPESVKINNAEFNNNGIPDLIEPDDADETYFDPELKVKAQVDNPYEFGNGFKIFSMVAMHDDGVSWRALVVMIEKFFDIAREKAEKQTQQVFTKWVRKGWVKIV